MSPPWSVAREALHLELERWQLRGARAVRVRAGQDTADLDAALDDVEQQRTRPGIRHERMRTLAARLSLTEPEVDLLWWVVAAASEPSVQRAAEALGGTRARRGASLGLFAEVAQLPSETARDLAVSLARGHRLVSAGLVRQPDDEVSAASALSPTPRLISYLLGDDTPDSSVTRIAVAAADRARHLYDRDQLRALGQLSELLGSSTPVLIALEGPSRTGRRSAISFASGRPVLSVDIERTGGRAPAVQQALRALRRELALADGIPVLSELALDRNAAAEAFSSIAQFVDEVPGPVVITTPLHSLDLGLSRPVVRVDWKVPDVAVRRRLWEQTLAGSQIASDDLDRISVRYRLGPGGIARAVASARVGRPGPLGASLGATEVIHGVRHNIAEGLAGLATRVEVTQTWDDLVLAEDTVDQVQALIARLTHAHQVLEHWGYREKLARGTGVAALFSGPPGTGKTMVAGLIARALDLELYQVDLSQVVSKWVGETEKQLSKVFDAAEAGHALLLFDEADALFGQRSAETKGATDRYANLEVNFLLQRIESFGGVTILTTNLDAAIDKALKRRLAGHIVFAAPDEDERAALWARLIRTATSPLASDLDFDELSNMFPAMTGANIRNAAIAAAFFAAGQGAAAIEQEHLRRAGRAEYRSMGHILAERSRH